MSINKQCPSFVPSFLPSFLSFPIRDDCLLASEPTDGATAAARATQTTTEENNQTSS
jgi:hypothetical protein